MKVDEYGFRVSEVNIRDLFGTAKDRQRFLDASFVDSTRSDFFSLRTKTRIAKIWRTLGADMNSEHVVNSLRADAIDTDLLKNLLEAGLNPNQPDKRGLTLIQKAAFYGEFGDHYGPSRTSILLDHDANPDIPFPDWYKKLRTDYELQPTPRMELIAHVTACVTKPRAQGDNRLVGLFDSAIDSLRNYDARREAERLKKMEGVRQEFSRFLDNH